MNKLINIAQNYWQYNVWIAALFVILGIVVAVLTGVLCKAFLKKEKGQDKQEKQTPSIFAEKLPPISGRIAELLGKYNLINFGPIAKTFLCAINTIRSSMYGYNWRYAIPWYVVLGGAKSGKTTLINSVNFYTLPTQDYDNDNKSWNWTLADKAAILEPPETLFERQTEGRNQLGWQFLSKLLLYFKPRRPLDGIILTLSAEEIIASQKNVNEIVIKAQNLFEQIWWLQKYIQLRVPIYLVITKSDKIPGFSMFSSFIGVEFKRQIFGWSNPYAVDRNFSTNIMDEALCSITKDIERISLNIESAKNCPDYAETAIILKDQLRQVFEVLSAYAKTLFHPSTDENSLMFRGVYFTGKDDDRIRETLEYDPLDPEAFLNNEAILSANKSELNFTDDLFMQKILPEANLSIPIGDSAAFSIKNTSLVTKLTFLFLSSVTVIGSVITYPELKHKCSNIHNILIHTGNALSLLKEEQKDKIENQTELSRSITYALDLMCRLEGKDIFSIFMPASWFSDIHKKIDKIINTAFNGIVMRSMYMDLKINATHLKAMMAASMGDEPLSLKTKPTDTKEFKLLSRLTSHTFTLEQAGGDYNKILKTGDNQIDIIDTDELTRYLFGKKYSLSKELREKPFQDYRDILFSLDEYKKQIKAGISRIYKEFLAVSLPSKFFKVLDNISESIEQFQNKISNNKDPLCAEDLIKLIGKLDSLIAYLNSPTNRWWNGDNFNPGPQYQVVMQKIKKSRILGPEFAQELQASGDRKLKEFKLKCAAYRTSLTGYLIERKNNLVKMTPSSSLTRLQKDLKLFINEPFMMDVKTAKITNTIPQGKILLWDKRYTAEAASLINKYEEFLNQRLQNMQTKSRNIYTSISRRILQNTVISLIAKSQIFEDEYDDLSRQAFENNLSRQTSNISEVMPSLLKVAVFLERTDTGISTVDCSIAEIILAQANQILDRIDGIFERDAPYSFDSGLFSLWNGSGPIGTSNLAFADEEQLKSYLVAQRNRIRTLAKTLAEPVLNLIKAPIFKQKIQNPELVEKWQDIVEKIDDYDKHKPGNAIATLENFLLTKMNSSSAEALEKDPEVKKILNYSGDEFFERQKKALVKLLLDRAQKVNHVAGHQLYCKMADNFNQNIAGRFPFASHNTTQEVEVSALKEFLSDYDSLSEDLKKSLIKSGDPDVAYFMQDLEASYPFLKAWTEHMSNPNPSNAVLSFRIKFRVKRGSEIYADEIIDWGLAIDNRSISIDSADPRVDWYPSDPVSLSLRWVFSSKQYPYPGHGVSGYSTEGRTAKFSYDGNWSVLRMVQVHALNKNLGSATGEILKFTVPITEVTRRRNLRKHAQVFIEITALKNEKGKWTPIVFPKLPRSAPKIDGNKGEKQ